MAHPSDIRPIFRRNRPVLRPDIDPAWSNYSQNDIESNIYIAISLAIATPPYDIPGMVMKGPRARVPPQARNTAGPSGASSPWAPGVQGGGAAPTKPPLRRATSPRKKGGPFLLDNDCTLTYGRLGVKRLIM